MRKFLRLLVVAGVVFTSIGFVGCKGDDGDPGPIGQDGVKGDKGDKGDKGEQGEGVGSTLSHGNVSVTYTGTRVDGVAFTKTVNYKFAPAGANEIAGYSGMRIESGNEKFFNVGRFLSVPDDVYQEDYVYTEFSINTESTTPFFNVTNFEVQTAIVTDDYKYFTLNDDYTDYIESDDLSGYSYDPATGDLKYKLNFVVPANGNNTEHDLTVAVTASVKVFQQIGDVTND